ncbi:hypothetical protein A2153_00075 [Candidatus Gottesmanbacteria bacterium RBG_16_38_7b]|uniref:DUF5671 domain-containing protein n=2 Tax=Candidatus Gottesmaniibacteriota TaxID=1752720 RepID=A0A1F5YLF2_9BACT|nr:MAG: hypothetical protein A2153_00075 [Candidatus Gottesmanbacteria bacterium RBG_16_38_7b]OGG31444.1 MAG: hypothetical protein A3I51_05050 [Candidatus Gottesmanbacteria bacterium RIFCSPLOWO2_02_FULL_38_8]
MVETKPATLTSPSVKESLWDTFEHILLFISLYVYAISFTLMLHQFVDVLSPGDKYSGWGDYIGSFSKYIVRGYMASLIVAYPLFSFFFIRVKKRIMNNLEIRHLRPRKTLIYFTMVVAFIIVLSSIISIIFNFLNGNVSVNFVLHFLATVLVAGLIFAYLLNEVKEERKVYA